MSTDVGREAGRGVFTTTRWLYLAAAAILVLVMTTPSFGQGKSQQKKGKGSPPSRSTLPAPTAIGRSTGATPFAWLDDASLMTPGGVWLGVSVARWAGTDSSEIDVPVIDVAIGLTPRLQVGASVPRVVGSSDPAGAAGGLGTTYFNAKIRVLDVESVGFKIAVAPTIEVLNASALAAAPDQGRMQWGLPASAEIDRGSARVYASTGYFSRGVWFAGAGGGWQATPRLGVSVSFSRAWSTTLSADPTVPSPNRNEVSGGAFYSLKSNLGVFGSVGHTIATDDADGAGMTVSIGMSLMVPPPRARIVKKR
jgi:hypothetical protein